MAAEPRPPAAEPQAAGDPPGTLGLIAGGGDLPRRIVEACRAGGRPVFVIALNGLTDPDLAADVPHQWLRIGAASKILTALREAGAGDLCLAGTFRRPSWRELMPDLRAARFLTKVGFSGLGDDEAMRAVRAELEAEGFRLVTVADVLAGWTAPAGLLTRAAPDAQALADIRRGLEVARTIGRLDAGQGAVVQQGIVLAVEAAEGTDAMLARCGALKREGPGGVLVKALKPQQDAGLDVPTIGATTVRGAAAAGLRGIAVEAGRAMLVDPPAIAAAADECGLFVLCLDQDADP
ncbi:MAG: UDP-2,3-diacylglucosamine diphosphatase LpxI [Alphaproteobacteria bacterium]|jgi:DUF1009 family protein|nr:UDP-2,3-diacylglucosamine diphosphatase LpxI [Alphaproteobacteria bacterium]